MDWSNESYVKVYTRETDDDLALSWEARALWDALIKKFDRSGVVATRRGARGLAALVRIPADIVDRVLPELLEDGRLREIEGGYISPNFIPAQEAKKSDKLRQKEARDRRRSTSLGVTPRDSTITPRDESVTRGHTASHGVTLCSADPDPDPDPLQSESPARAIPPSGEHGTEQPAISVDDRVRLNQEGWKLGAETHRELREKGLDANAIAWPPMPAGPARDAVAARTREVWSSHFGTSYQSALAVVARRIATAKAVAVARGNLHLFTPSKIWDADEFWRDAEQSPEQATARLTATPRAGPHAMAPPLPIRKLKDL